MTDAAVLPTNDAIDTISIPVASGNDMHTQSTDDIISFKPPVCPNVQCRSKRVTIRETDGFLVCSRCGCETPYKKIDTPKNKPGYIGGEVDYDLHCPYCNKLHGETLRDGRRRCRNCGAYFIPVVVDATKKKRVIHVLR